MGANPWGQVAVTGASAFASGFYGEYEKDAAMQQHREWLAMQDEAKRSAATGRASGEAREASRIGTIRATASPVSEEMVQPHLKTIKVFLTDAGLALGDLRILQSQLPDDTVAMVSDDGTGIIRWNASKPITTTVLLHEIGHVIQVAELGDQTYGQRLAYDMILRGPSHRYDGSGLGPGLPRLSQVPLANYDLTRGGYTLEGLAEFWSQAVVAPDLGDPAEWMYPVP